MSTIDRWILLVEDHPTLRSTLALLLRRAGFAVAEAGDPEQAVRALDNRAFDAAVVDLNLRAKLDGLGVLEQVRARCPAARRVLMSGDVPPGVEKSVTSELAQKFLLKPVALDSLLAAIEGPLRSHRTLLLVEDDVEASHSMAEALRGEGYAVVTAANGLDALDALRAGPAPHAILLDLRMPVMDGFRFCEVRSADPRLADIPVIVLTAVREMPPLTQLGARAVVPKPIDLLRFGQILELLEQPTG